MKPIKFLFVIALTFSCFSKGLFAQQPMTKAGALDAKQQSIVAISAFTTTGNLGQLETALSDGLEAGMTVNEIKEVLVHLYAYCGFPRSLQGINTFMAVVERRKANGIADKVGKEAAPARNSGRTYEQGKRTLEALTGQKEREPKTGYAAFSPVVDTFLKEHLFADIFGRGLLTYSEREMATLSALASLGGVEPMLQGHMRIALHLGITETQLSEVLSLIEVKVGKEKAEAGRRVLVAVTNPKAIQKVTDTTKNDKPLFAKGVKAPASNFTGTAWVNILVQAQDGLDCSVGMVTFEPGARTNWHRHPGGQVLMVTEGKGYYQERGQPKREVQIGDVMKCPPEVEHWHGASPDSKLSHIAISTNAERGNVVWLQKVTDEEYHGLK